MTEIDYYETAQTVCPRCKSEDITDVPAGDTRGDGLLVTCYECGLKWNEPEED
jgi:uncharacterized Zn finger protein